MRRTGLALIFSLVMTGTVMAQSAEDGSAIQGVIGDQIEAFKADDFGRAFTFAGPGIQGMFRSPENFGAMVRGGYPMVWRPQSLRFGDLREERGALMQRIIVQDAQGMTHVLDYRMGFYDGEWRIDGVTMVRAPDVAA